MLISRDVIYLVWGEVWASTYLLKSSLRESNVQNLYINGLGIIPLIWKQTL